MDPDERRSKGVTATTVDVPATAPRALDFDALYRDARDDVFAYAATLLRDSAAAEDVTAAGVRARLPAPLPLRRPPRDRRARGCSASRATPRSTSCAGASAPRPPRSPRPTPEPGPDEAAELAAERDAVRAALGRLGARDRELIALKYHADLSNAELAAVLGVSATNAGTLLHRAMTKLREAVDA